MASMETEYECTACMYVVVLTISEPDVCPICNSNTWKKMRYSLEEENGYIGRGRGQEDSREEIRD